MRGLHLDWRRGICVILILLACLSISTVTGAASEESVEAAEITLPEDLVVSRRWWKFEGGVISG